ncbi:alpha-galactosidase [Streptomyces sp. RB6PN25]|uniref:alpha-galactosidase n=1 Tax=Streptomyces humicola TaxID=2953240 RepID=A0ABT1PPM7_9ACTN|nr:alpha-galactosidase [Streptomyces humicola]MCQ4079629.1 alpha-galactosidase [Streptomyces humicola]
MTQHHAPLILTAGGTSLVLDTSGPALPRVLYWGSDLGTTGPHSAAAFDAVSAGTPDGSLTLLPLQGDGWAGRPGIAGDRAGMWPHLRLRLTTAIEHAAPAGGGAVLTVHAADEEAGVAVRTELRLTPEGVVRIRHTVTNNGPGSWTVGAVRGILPVPEEAAELLDLTGRWGLERVPQRTAFGFGTRSRESRKGRPGHDAATVLVAGTPGFGFRHGQVWAAHVAWSGDTEHYAERFPDTTGVLGGGELPASGEIRLGPGERHTSPWVYFVHSDHGLDGVSDRLHRLLRARPNHPRGPRPVVLNTWEAVYFDQDLARLRQLADRAQQVGVERFVLDDGWFRGRRDDTAGLGDWYVDEKVWPDGLHPLVDHVRSLGMEFGLWVEPEMVNLDSELARRHPEWLLAAEGRLPAPHRNQHVLDLARPEAFAHIRERLDALLTEYPITYLKWDHNRPLVEAVHDGAAGVHRQTRAVYALMDQLRAAHPGLEIESCSSGGGRVDLGIIEHTDRVWASDTNDPIDRQHIQRWTGLLLPPELIGSHIGPATAHVTRRTTRLSFRSATALFGHAGIEWDLTQCSTEELIELKGWATAYRRLRGLLHSGRTVRADHPDPAAVLHGVVAEDGRRAVFGYLQLDSPVASSPARLRLPGLRDDLDYRIALCPELPVPEKVTGPLVDGAVTLPGRVLAAVGLAVPRLDPADALVFEIEVAQG